MFLIQVDFSLVIKITGVRPSVRPVRPVRRPSCYTVVYPKHILNVLITPKTKYDQTEVYMDQ